jgi:hypothetical protein
MLAMAGERKFEPLALWECPPAKGPMLMWEPALNVGVGLAGGGKLTTGKKDSAYHSYHTLVLSATLHTDTCSSELLGR